MRYMLLIYTREEEVAGRSAEEREKVKAANAEVIHEMRAQGILEGAEPLASTATAACVRKQDGKLLTTDGPFAETKEQLAGYYILDCKDLDEAIAWARRIPTCGGRNGGIEIRPLPAMKAGGFLQELVAAGNG